jgi:SnoaL-like polyketide cyclase
MTATWEDATEGEIDDQAQGGPAILEDTKSFVAVFPDIHVETLRVIALGDLFAIEWRDQGTHPGTSIERGGVMHQPTGARPCRDGVGIARIRDGKVVFCRDHFDRSQMYEQVGWRSRMRI